MHSNKGHNNCCSINIQSPSAGWRGWRRRKRGGNARKKSRSERDANRRKEKERGGGRRRGGGRWSDSRGWERRRNRRGKVSVRRAQKERGIWETKKSNGRYTHTSHLNTVARQLHPLIAKVLPALCCVRTYRPAGGTNAIGAFTWIPGPKFSRQEMWF